MNPHNANPRSSFRHGLPESRLQGCHSRAAFSAKCAAFVVCVYSQFVNAAEPVLSATAYGKITFGMNLSRAEKLLSEKAHLAYPAIEGVDCHFVYFDAYRGMEFLVEDAKITRGDVKFGSDIPNALHVKREDAFDAVRKRYPTVKIEQHQYDPAGHYLIFKTADRKNAIVLEESKGKIEDIRAGTEPAVEYVEGCL